MKALLLGLLLCLVFVARAANEGPSNAGVYAKSGEDWVKLDLTQAATTKALVKRVIVQGESPPMVWVFRNSRARVKVSEKVLKFLVCDIADFDERKVMIVKLTRKANRRELRSNVSEDKTPQFAVFRLSARSFLIAPRVPLHPGEYMITVRPGLKGYDFSVQ